METLVAAHTGNTQSSTQAGAEFYDSISVYTDSVNVFVDLRMANDSYSVGFPPALEEWLGVGLDGFSDGGTYPPPGTALNVNYTIPQAGAPQLDAFSVLQLRTGIVSALSGDGKPAAILSQFSVPHGTAIGADYSVIPPVPLEVPCQLTTHVNELRFQITNYRGQTANLGGNSWSASILLTIYEP